VSTALLVLGTIGVTIGESMAAKKKRKLDVRFVTQFRHYPDGKMLKASDFGLVAFPIGHKRPTK